ncbi:U4/U6-U5 snRNP complex subunit LSM8 Ecym_7382 [Eremothecium cymbalariae DBVPG|uniref:LSM2-LSM8 complex subunit LSM8 n=1 Tax=Eremothecium cymbalariae (strain CBS 270.75 / DBVPG 7215 / KCTC 17166 / NRRL Y-17582) TaxID=931890 RepID=G8JWJ3_ERECY|nr:hypothetical protein Ecym_7382 [Eremothecium cymbalariae DBVPG\
MSPLLKDFLNRQIVVITTEGDCFTATLEGYDKTTNLLLSNVKERLTGSKVAGSYLLQGSQIVCCGPLEGSEEIGQEHLREMVQLKNTKNMVEMEHIVWSKVWESTTH